MPAWNRLPTTRRWKLRLSKPPPGGIRRRLAEPLLEIEVDGPDEQAAMQALLALIQDKFGEGE